MTEYVILKATNEAGTIFSVIGGAVAHSPEGAIRMFDDPDAAIFAAVPKRSWTVVKVQRQIKETLQVTRL